MTIDELYEKMQQLEELLENTNDSARQFDLHLQIQTLKIARAAAILDPLTDINALTAVDLSKLGDAINAANSAINDIEKRNEAVGRAMMIVKTALKAAGLGA